MHFVSTRFAVLSLGLFLTACGGHGGGSAPPSGGGGGTAPTATISSFSAGNVRIGSGTTATLTAVFADGSATIDNGVGAVASSTPVATAALAHTTTFTLTVTGAGGTAIRTLTIRVPDRYAPTVGDPGTARAHHTATLLANGKILITGGQNGGGYLNGAQLYDPATGRFTATGNLATARAFHTATLLTNGQVLIVGGYNGGYLTSAELYDPATGSFGVTGSIVGARASHTATLLNSGKVLVAGGSDGAALGTAQLYNPASGLFEATGGLNNARQQHTATLLLNGKVLLASGSTAYGSGYLTSAELFDPAANGGAGSFTATGNVGTPRTGHATAVLADGRVMLIGGFNGVYLASTELFDSAGNGGVGSFAGFFPMATARTLHSVTTLADGRVLIAGGQTTGNASLTDSETYDPATFTFSAADTLATARASHTATPLANGQVLMVGGLDGGNYIDGAEFFDPATGASQATRPVSGSGPACPALPSPPYDSTQAAPGQTCPTAARANHTQTLLPNGKILIAGGSNSGGALISAELYDPATGVFAATGDLKAARAEHTATLLANGKVLLAGGNNGGPLNTAELYDPDSGTFSYTTATANNALTTLHVARGEHTATLLADGRVLLAGGGTDTTEIYDPASGDFVIGAAMSRSRLRHTATLLPNGHVLIAGGWNSVDAHLDSAELFDPAANGGSGQFTATGNLTARRAWHTATLLPNGKVLLAAGFFSGLGTDSAELYDPLTGTSAATGNLNATRGAQTATLLSNGLVLIAGGYKKSSELYNPATGTFVYAGPLTIGRGYHTATLLPSGQVLIVGGDNVTTLPTAELFTY